MKLKYYLRGLGIGIFVATLILMIAYRITESDKMSDDEIIKKAKKLGMVMAEDETLFLDTTTKDESKSETETSETQTETTETETETTEEETTTQPETTTVEETTTQPETTTEEETKPSESVKSYVLEIKKGMYSEAVCALLFQNGIITDEMDFNQYLEDYKYSEWLSVGSYTVTSDMTYEQIAKLITKKY